MNILDVFCEKISEAYMPLNFNVKFSLFRQRFIFLDLTWEIVDPYMGLDSMVVNTVIKTQ